MLILLNAVWFVLVPFALPGNWLIVITTALFAWWHAEDGIFSLHTLVAITALAILGEGANIAIEATNSPKSDVTTPLSLEVLTHMNQIWLFFLSKLLIETS